MQQFLWNGEQALAGSARDPAVYEQWLSFIAQNVHTYRLEKRMPETSLVRIHARSRSVEGFAVARFVTTRGGCRLLRDTAGIAGDGRDGYVLQMSACGGMDISQFGRNQLVTAGSYTFISAAEPLILDNHEGGSNDTLCFSMPRDFVDRRIINGERLCLRPQVAAQGMSSLLFDTVSAFQKNAWDLTDSDFSKSARVVADLVLLVLGGSIDLSSGERSIRAANLARAKRIIRLRLADPELALADVARESRLSLSYLHNLFRDEGRTAREYLQGERLQRARDLLESSAPREMTVTEVSLRCGFSNMGHFSTAFKRAFGVSPRDVLRHR